jgi:DNA-binding CsgD family transcriptional regulator
VTETGAVSDAGAADWLDTLVTSGAVYAVGLDQRIRRWGASEELLGPASEALGRRCYELTAALDPRNAGRCRPNCAVVVAARQGRAHRDFEFFLPPCTAFDRARVSIMLANGGDGGEPLVVHLVQPVQDDGCHHDGPGELRALLEQAVSQLEMPERAEAAEPPRLTARQRDVLARLAAGESPAEIALALGVSAITVRNHIHSAMERLGARNRLQAVIAATNGGLL